MTRTSQVKMISRTSSQKESFCTFLIQQMGGISFYFHSCFMLKLFICLGRKLESKNQEAVLKWVPNARGFAEK